MNVKMHAADELQCGTQGQRKICGAWNAAARTFAGVHCSTPGATPRTNSLNPATPCMLHACYMAELHLHKASRSIPGTNPLSCFP